MSDDADLPLPRTWGRYTLTEVLGRGGMGAVYGATLRGRGGFEKEVALKVLHPGNSGEHLLEEARLGGFLRHPYVVETYDVGIHEDQVFFAMEWVRGPTLHQVLKGRNSRVPLGTAFDVVQHLCLGLDYAHTLSVRGSPLGLVHLDIKPQNVLLDPVGMTKITDFGIARAMGFRTHDMEVQGGIGTRGYMAPEMVQADPVDARADVFAVATLCAELVLGRRLWPRKGGWIAYGRAVVNGREWMAAEGLAAELDTLVEGLGPVLVQALDPVVDARTASLADLHEALHALNPRDGSIAELVAEHRGAKPRPAVRPPSATTGSVRRRTNLPRSEGELVGREDELATVLASVEAPGLVTLKGPGGVGKTRLAREVGRVRLPQIDGGVWFVDLAACSSGDEALQEVRSALDVPVVGGDLDARAASVGSGIGRLGPMLVILDNMEQLVDELAEPMARWPALAPDVTFLVTSQRRLGVPGERLVPLGALEVEAGADLFVRRAGVQGLTSAEPHVRRIVEQLDGLPLAIELAAARARVMTPQQILEALSDRFGVLVDRTGRRPGRHRTLHNAVDWSWQLLTRWQQAALAQLSVFRGVFSLGQAQRVLNLEDWPEAPWPMFILEDLLDRSLLRLVPGKDPRFRMLLGVREFAETRLAQPGAILTMLGSSGSGPEARDAACRRHAALYAEFGAPDASYARIGPEALQATRALLDASADIRFATDQAVRLDEGELAFQAVRAWCEIQRKLSHPSVIPKRLERVLSCKLKPMSRVALLFQHGKTSAHLGDWEAQQAATEQAMALAREHENDFWIGNLSHFRALHAWNNGDGEGAARLWQDALDAAVRNGDRQGELVFRTNLAQLAYERGNYLESRDRHLEILPVAEEEGAMTVLADNRHALASTLFQLGCWEEARTGLAEALVTQEALGRRRQHVHGEVLMARIHHHDGEDAAAAASFRVAAELAKKHTGPAVVSGVYADTARWLAELDPGRAVAMAERALAVPRLSGQAVGVARSAHACALAAVGRLDEARHEAYAALQDLKGGSFERRVQGRLTHGLVAALQGQLDVARADLDVCRMHLEASGVPDHAPLGLQAKRIADLLGG